MINPIETAVAPLKNDAMQAAEDYAKNIIEKAKIDLAAADFDFNKVAPYPNSMRCSRREYMVAIAKRAFFGAVTERDEAKNEPNKYKPHAPNYVHITEKSRAKFINDAREDAAASYDAFIAKLISKIGATIDAKLTGNHVWSCSYLTVTKPTGAQETWKTQTIINVSKLGKVFNQFPTRKVKR